MGILFTLYRTAQILLLHKIFVVFNAVFIDPDVHKYWLAHAVRTIVQQTAHLIVLDNDGLVCLHGGLECQPIISSQARRNVDSGNAFSTCVNGVQQRFVPFSQRAVLKPCSKNSVHHQICSGQ